MCRPAVCGDPQPVCPSIWGDPQYVWSAVCVTRNMCDPQFEVICNICDPQFEIIRNICDPQGGLDNSWKTQIWYPRRFRIVFVSECFYLLSWTVHNSAVHCAEQQHIRTLWEIIYDHIGTNVALRSSPRSSVWEHSFLCSTCNNIDGF